MKKTPRIGSLSLMVLVCAVLIVSCGKSTVTGRVVDAETGKPIEAAAVHIFWAKSGSGPPGLGGKVKVDVAETLTDADGKFEVPKYYSFFKNYYLAVYKQGYVCWSNRKVFPTYEERRDFKLKTGMVINLEHFIEKYSKIKHANFTIVASVNRVGGGTFDKAIESEKQILINKQSIKGNN